MRGVDGLGAKLHAGVAKGLAAVDRGGERAGTVRGRPRRRQLLPLPLRRSRAEQRPLVVDPQRPHQPRDLPVLVGERFDRQFAAGIAVAAVASAGKGHAAENVLQADAEIDPRLLQSHG